MCPRRHLNNRLGRLAMAMGAALLVLFPPMAPVAAQELALETAVKATFLIKFAAFVEWPASAFGSPSSPLYVCVMGPSLGSTADQAAAGQMVGQHPLIVRHIAATERPQGCGMLYAAESSQQLVDAALDAVRGQPVLTVTDLPPTAPRKGIINFVLQSNHVRFEIDDREATRNGLRISSQLLALAVNAGAR